MKTSILPLSIAALLVSSLSYGAEGPGPINDLTGSAEVSENKTLIATLSVAPAAKITNDETPASATVGLDARGDHDAGDRVVAWRCEKTFEISLGKILAGLMLTDKKGNTVDHKPGVAVEKASAIFSYDFGATTVDDPSKCKDLPLPESFDATSKLMNITVVDIGGLKDPNHAIRAEFSVGLPAKLVLNTTTGKYEVQNDPLEIVNIHWTHILDRSSTSPSWKQQGGFQIKK